MFLQIFYPQLLGVPISLWPDTLKISSINGCDADATEASHW